MPNTKTVLFLEIAGTIIIILLGSALHFTYELSGNNSFVGVFSAVNESVWEHMKLAFWPSLFWMVMSMLPLRNSVKNLFSAKTAGTYTMVTLIPAIFYSYTAFTNESILAIDIATFVVAIIAGQFVSYRLFKYKMRQKATTIAIIAIVILAIIFIVFTFYPPHLPIFQDSITGQYGV